MKIWLIGKQRILKMKKGEIWLSNLPQQLGKEVLGKRPVLIMADTIKLAIVIPLTSNLNVLKYENTIKIAPSKINCLTRESIASLFQIRSLDRKRIIHKIGNLEGFYMKEIDNTLKKLLKL